MLSVNDINVYYGAIHALKGVSFHVEEGEIVSLIGANGAGKTTAMHTISGLLHSKTGDITFMGNSISKTEPHRIVRLGLAQVPEGRRVFASMTVQENLEMGAYARSRSQGREIEQDLALVFKRFPRLKERRRQQAGTLSGGEQQMLAIGRALMSRPKMLLLDEPSMGLSPILVQEIFSCIRESTRAGQQYCWSSRTPRWRCRCPTGRMYLKPAVSFSKQTSELLIMTRSRRPISEDDFCL